MIIPHSEPLEAALQFSDFRWPPENEAGGWESLDPWPCPLGGVVIEKEKGHIQFQYCEPFVAGRGALELASADFQMLKDFAELCTGEAVADGRLLRFASHYGALGLCKLHGW